jgi:hypothetical protein
VPGHLIVSTDNSVFGHRRDKDDFHWIPPGG